MRSLQIQALADEIRRIEGGFGNPAQRLHLPTGIAPLDERLPGGGLAAAAIHELVAARPGAALRTLAAHFARRAAAPAGDGGAAQAMDSSRRTSQSICGCYVLWLDMASDFYPPAILAQGLAAEQLVLLRPADRREALWGMDQALRCRGVAAVVGSLPRLSRSEARRLQLAAEAGGGIGLLLCPKAAEQAAGGVASRWRLSPAPSAGEAQRFVVEVEKCRGGRPIPPVLLEIEGGTRLVAVPAAVADRPRATSRPVATA